MPREWVQWTEPGVLRFILVVVALVAAPHVQNVPSSISLYCLLVYLYSITGLYRPALLPGRALLFAIAAAGLGLIYLEHGTFLGLLAGTSFFLVSLVLKLLELKQRRDLYVVIFLAFFVAITQFLFNQSLLMALYVLVVTGLLTAGLIKITLRNSLPAGETARLSVSLVLQAFPLMVLMFVLFPRIPAPKVGLGLQPGQGITGLSDSLSPGQISRLSQSSAVAFRATFVGRIPEPEQRYWRGPVFWKTDGEGWTLLSKPLGVAREPLSYAEPYEYSVVIEPHGKNWLFALDLPVHPPNSIRQSADFLLHAKKPVVGRTSYTLISYSSYKTGKIAEWEKRLGLQLPANQDRRVVELVTSWREPGADAEAVVGQALDYFNRESFFYTLSPPLYENRPVETFLFEGRRGFCEHYASAFVILMRNAGIPARIVTGYQGGELNALGGFLEVRQSDAHAWAEVWIDERGWVRIDPTSAVAPERIERGIEAVAGFNAVGGSVPFLGRAARQIGLLWASADHAWHKWVIAYNAVSQNRLLDRLGIRDLQTLVRVMVALVLVVLLAAGFFVLRDYRRESREEVVLYRRFCSRLAADGLVRGAAEGANDFAERVIQSRPEITESVLAITRSYQNLRYGKNKFPENLERLRREVRAFNSTARLSGGIANRTGSD